MVRERVGDPWRSKEDGSLLLGTVLWTVDRLAPLLRALGLDFALFRELLRVRVLLALRRESGSRAMRSAGIALALMMTTFAGFATGIVGLTTSDASHWIVLSLSILIALLMMLLFQVLAGILVDPTDLGVVAPHPVSDGTVFGVRLAEVFAWVFMIGAAFTVGNVGLATFGQAPLAVLFVYPLLALLCATATLGAVALLFALALRVVGPTHFQRVTLWAQILGGILLFSAGQLPRLVRLEQWELWGDELERLKLLWPPFQYAEIFAWASGTAREVPLVSLLSAVLTPLVALAVTFWLASRYFVAGLQGTLSAPKPHARWPGGNVTRVGKLLTRGTERAAFDFTAALSRREPHFLRGVLPQLVMFQAMTLSMGLGRHRDLEFFLPASAGFLFLVLPNILMLAQSSSSSEARGVFDSAPLESKAELVRGGVKALLVQWVGLPAVVVLVVQLWIAGAEALPRVVLAIGLSFVGALSFARLYQLGVPFTRPVQVGDTSAANLGLVLGGGLGMLALGGVHWVLSRHPLVLAAGIAGCALLIVVLWRGLGRLRSAPEPRPRRATAS